MFQGRAESPDLIGETIARTPVERYIAGYEKTRGEMAGRGKRAGSAG